MGLRQRLSSALLFSVALGRVTCALAVLIPYFNVNPLQEQVTRNRKVNRFSRRQ
jgi:hypothetical protein